LPRGGVRGKFPTNVNLWRLMDRARTESLGAGAGGTMPRLLLIQQAPLIQELTRSFARREGFELIAVPTGREILHRAREQGADLIVGAVIMPMLSGLEMCTLLRATDRTSSIPVLLIGPESERERASAVGASGFLAQPWTGRQLRGAIREFLPLEERGSGRAPLTLKVVCRRGFETWVAFTRDISASGLYLKGPADAVPGDQLLLRLRLPGEPDGQEVELVAEVVRRVPAGSDATRTSGFGLRFLDFPLLRKLPISRFVREHSVE